MPAPIRRVTKEQFTAASQLALSGIFTNAALAIIKVGVGVLGNAYALIADGIESTLDIFSSLVIWSGLRFAAKPADDSHPYGHGKAEPLAAVAVSLFIIGAACGLAVQSVKEILTPHHAPAPYTLAVLVGVVGLKEFLFRRMQKAGDELGSTAVKTEAWHHRSDAITSVAAFIGITIALIGGKGYEAADDWAALLACALIAYNGWLLLIPALNEAMDVAPPPHVEEGVRAAAISVPEVVEVEQCRMRKMGIDLFVDLHVAVNGDLSVREGHRIAHQVKDAIRAANASVVDVLVHIEPAEEQPAASTPA